MATATEAQTGKGARGSADGIQELFCSPAAVCAEKRQQRFSSPRKVQARTNPQLGVSSLQKMAEHKFLLHFPPGKKKKKKPKLN